MICLPIIALGQSGEHTTNGGGVAGRITSKTGEPLELVSVSLIQLNKSTLTDNDGRYQLQDIAPGKYTLRIQLLGAAEKDFQLEIVNGEVATLDYQLPKENIQALQEVRVLGTVNKFSKKESVYVSRLPLKNLENPQVYNIIPKE
jgi:iron complex outermembrane receptor protein